MRYEQTLYIVTIIFYSKKVLFKCDDQDHKLGLKLFSKESFSKIKLQQLPKTI